MYSPTRLSKFIRTNLLKDWKIKLALTPLFTGPFIFLIWVFPSAVSTIPVRVAVSCLVEASFMFSVWVER